MPAAADSPLPQPQPQKLSRYRTIRGRNVPESRRFVEPIKINTAVAAAPRAEPPVSSLPPLIPLPHARSAAHGDEHGVAADGRRFYAPGSSDVLDPDEVARRAAAAEKLLAEQKRKDLERLQAQLANHQPASPVMSPIREKLSFFSRRRGQTLQETAAVPPASSEVAPEKPARANTTAAVKPHSPRPPQQAALPADPSPEPRVDAPSSAPDSGTSRPVSVRCRQISSRFDSQPETTVTEVLRAYSTRPQHPYDVDSSALTESYVRLGLERRLRRYERIRDIMNSWDNDADNALVVFLPSDVVSAPGRKASRISRVPVDFDATMPGRGGHGADLELAAVPRSRTPPAGFSFLQMHYSQKPGRWNKRFISLASESGQIIASKKADASRLSHLLASESGIGANAGGSGDFHSICHLSDYDIYTPTEAHVRKQLKPPKKFCFAVKSQQRTTIFLNTENYVHFFCTDDAILAQQFYDLVFAWRSWYLVTRKLAIPSHTPPTAAAAGQHATGKPEPGPTHREHPPMSSVARKGTLRRSASKRSGSLAAADRKPMAESGTGFPGEPRTLSITAGGEQDAFDPQGLLGSAYDERKRLEAAKQADASPPALVTSLDRSFAAGSLLGSQSPVHTTPAVSAQHDGRSHAAGQADARAPMVPEYEERARYRSRSAHEPAVAARSSSSSGFSASRGRHQHADSERPISRHRSLYRSTSRARGHPAQLAQPLPEVPQLPAPLIDLTPKFQEAPQWNMERRGHGVRAPPGTAHLVDLATGRDAANAALPSANNVLRRETSTGVVRHGR